MESLILQQVEALVNQVEKQINRVFKAAEELDVDYLNKQHEGRLKEVEQIQHQKQAWIASGHGEYTEIQDEKEFFEIAKKSKNIVCLFYKNDVPKCNIADNSLKYLAEQHIETRFIKLNVERSPFLTEYLRIKSVPAMILIADGKRMPIFDFLALESTDAADFCKPTLLESIISLTGTIRKVEDQVDKQIDTLLEATENFDVKKLRKERLEEIEQIQLQKQLLFGSDHGRYSEISDEIEFFNIAVNSRSIVCLFQKDDAPECEIADMALEYLAEKYVDTRFITLNVENSPFLTRHLKIKIDPTIAIMCRSMTMDYIVDFMGLGKGDNFSTERLESRIVEYPTMTGMAYLMEKDVIDAMPAESVETLTVDDTTKLQETVRKSGEPATPKTESDPETVLTWLVDFNRYYGLD